MPKHSLTIFILTIFIYSCKGHPDRKTVDPAKNTTIATVKEPVNSYSLKAVLKKNLDFFGDSLLKADRRIIRSYISKYQNDTCEIRTYKNGNLRKEFEGVKTIKSIRGNKRADSVFVVPPFNYCDDGESYCFNDQTLPRLYTESYCCHPGNLFVAPDIDEDGIREIGIYYSGCTGRYKLLKIYSLKVGKWKQIGESGFDILTQDPEKVQFDKLVKKEAKGKFKICNFMDGKTTWETATLK